MGTVLARPEFQSTGCWQQIPTVDLPHKSALGMDLPVSARLGFQRGNRRGKKFDPPICVKAPMRLRSAASSGPGATFSGELWIKGGGGGGGKPPFAGKLVVDL